MPERGPLFPILGRVRVSRFDFGSRFPVAAKVSESLPPFHGTREETCQRKEPWRPVPRGPRNAPGVLVVTQNVLLMLTQLSHSCFRSRLCLLAVVLLLFCSVIARPLLAGYPALSRSLWPRTSKFICLFLQESCKSVK